MTPLQLAWQQWVENTTPHPKEHRIGKQVYTDDFRRYGEAIVWLELESDYLLISKIEALQPGRGAAKKVIEFLKALCDKHKIRLFGRAVTYSPDPPVPFGRLLSQAELEEWYGKRGFQVRPITANAADIGYPDLPPD